MEQQTIFFKEISKINLFDLKSESRLELAKKYRLKLVANSNKYAIVAFGYKNVLKIFNSNEFESASDNQVPNNIATINLEQSNQFVHIDFNKTQTHLIALVQNFKTEKIFEYFLNVYALESIKVDVDNSKQSPILLNSVALENDNSPIKDVLVSLQGDDLVILNKENGKIEIVSKIMDQNFNIISKQMDALCICWSPTGKNLAYCSKDKHLNICGLDLNMKHKYQCLENDLEPNSIKWLEKKEFLVSYNDAKNDPKFFYHKISKAQGQSEETFYKQEFDGAVFAMGDQNDISWVDFHIINDFNLIICAYSKSSEMGILVKNNQKYELVFLDDLRPNLPMTHDDNETFPIGVEISLNSQKEIDFDTRGKQPPSPLLFCLTDTGYLSTFYIINMAISNKSICKAAEKLAYSQMIAPVIKTQTPVSTETKIIPNFPAYQSAVPKPAIQSKPIEQKPTIPEESSTPNFNQPLATQAKPLDIAQNTPKINDQQNFNTQINNFQQQLPKIVPEQSKGNVQTIPFSNNQTKPEFQTPSFSVKIPGKTEVKLVHQKEIDSEKFNDILVDFDRELNEFRDGISKLFDGKDLSINFVDLKIIKQTKQSIEAYEKLNKEMVQFEDNCSDIRSSLLNCFNNFEVLRLLKSNIENKKSIGLINQLDQDPFFKAKCENLYEMYQEIDLEVDNLKKRIGNHRKEANIFISNKEIYSKIYAVDKILTERTRKLNRLMDQLKVSKIGKNIVHEINLNSPKKKDITSPVKSFLEKAKKKGEITILSGKMSDLDLDYDKEIREKCEKNSKLNSQLYNLFKKRKFVPNQTLNIGQLESIACNYIESKTTQVPLNDTSFLHFNQASPNVSRVLDSSIQQNVIQFQPKPDIQTPQKQPNFQLNKQKEIEKKNLTTSTPTHSSTALFSSGFTGSTIFGRISLGQSQPELSDALKEQKPKEPEPQLEKETIQQSIINKDGPFIQNVTKPGIAEEQNENKVVKTNVDLPMDKTLNIDGKPENQEFKMNEQSEKELEKKNEQSVESKIPDKILSTKNTQAKPLEKDNSEKIFLLNNNNFDIGKSFKPLEEKNQLKSEKTFNTIQVEPSKSVLNLGTIQSDKGKSVLKLTDVINTEPEKSDKPLEASTPFSLTKSIIQAESRIYKIEDKKQEINLFGPKSTVDTSRLNFELGNGTDIIRENIFDSSTTANINQNTKEIETKDQKVEKTFEETKQKTVLFKSTSIHSSPTTFGIEQKKEQAKPGQNLFVSFASGETKPVEQNKEQAKPVQNLFGSFASGEAKPVEQNKEQAKPVQNLFGSFASGETKPVEQNKEQAKPVQNLFGSFASGEAKPVEKNKEQAKPGQNLFGSFASGETKPDTGNSFGPIFGQTQSPSIFGTKVDSKPAFSSGFSSPKPAENPFSTIAAQKSNNIAVENDADMDSSSVISSNNIFGGFDLGSSKPINEPTKNVFGGAGFSSSFGATKQEAFKPSSEGSLIKTATFSANTQPTATFGASSGSTVSASGNLFTSFTSPNKPTFGSPPAFGGSPGFGQSASFGAPASFGGSSTFGASSTFGSTSANVPTFGSLASGNTPSFGGFGQSSSNTENGFGALAAQSQNQPGSLFSSFKNNSGGFSNNASFTSYRK